MIRLKSTASRKSIRLYAGAAAAGIATLVSVGAFAPTAWTASSVITPSVTASGTPGISATVRTITTTTGQIDLHFSVTPAGEHVPPGRELPARYRVSDLAGRSDDHRLRGRRPDVRSS